MDNNNPIIEQAVNLIKEKIAIDKAQIWIEDNCSVDYKQLIFEEKNIDIYFMSCVDGGSIENWFEVFYYNDRGHYIDKNNKRYNKFTLDTIEDALVQAYKLV